MKMKIKTDSIIIFLSCLLFAYSPHLSQTMNNIVFLGVSVILLLSMFHRSVFKVTLKECIPVIIFWIITVICTVKNLGMTSRTVNAIVTGMRYVVIFMVYCQLSIETTAQEVADTVFKILFAVTTIEDLTVLITAGHGIVNDGTLAYFLFGNKFGVSYLHLFTLALLLFHISMTKGFSARKPFFWVYWVYSIAMCLIADCNTGVIGCLVIGVMTFIAGKKDKFIKAIDSPLVYLLVFIGLTFLLVGTDVIVNNRFLATLLQKYSHTNKILTGRLDMYQIAIYAILQKPFLGYGINNTVVSDTLTWGNAQNGLLKILLDYGVIGTIAFLNVCRKSIYQRVKGNINEIVFPLLTFLYSMAVCSMVEINLSGYYFAGLALVNAVQATKYYDAKDIA